MFSKQLYKTHNIEALGYVSMCSEDPMTAAFTTTTLALQYSFFQNR
jgi:hypothetical protein